MRILIHDFAGHPFQTLLSESLAKRGHSVTHAYFAGDKGPKGVMNSRVFDGGGSVVFKAIGKKHGYEKSEFVARVVRDLSYRRSICDYIAAVRFDIVLSGNTPLWIQGAVLSASKASGAVFVFWCQDFYSIAVAKLLAARLPIIHAPIAWSLKRWDRLQFKRSSHVVHITDKFAEQTEAWGISRDYVDVIPNWGALEEIEVCGHRNEWHRKNVNSSLPVVLYSGTLGLKHNPDLILRAASDLAAQFVVVGFGVGFDKLLDSNIERVKLLPLQPFNIFPEVLGSATVLIAVIEREAGNFSVPSKVLSYLCAGRPIVLAAPADNLASSIIRESGAGLVVEPEDSQGFTEAIKRIIEDPDLAESMGKAGRRYAEDNFDIDIVTSRFEEVFEKALGRVK